MKYKAIIERIDIIQELHEDLTDAVTKLTNECKKNRKEIKDLKNKNTEMTIENSRHHYYLRELEVKINIKLKGLSEREGEQDTKFIKLTDRFDNEFQKYKQRLNDHYYTLQKAFNDFVKGESANHDSYSRLERAIRDIHSRLDENDKQMLKLFFNGENKKDL